MDRIFISYAREDGEIALRLYRDLKEDGFQPWIDQENLMPGERWKSVIRRVMSESKIVIALLSHKSISKRGFFQKELRHAADILQEIPDSDIFLIPARVDDCRPTDPLIEAINWVDLFPDYEHGLNRIIAALKSNSGDLQSSLASPGIQADSVAVKHSGNQAMAAGAAPVYDVPIIKGDSIIVALDEVVEGNIVASEVLVHGKVAGNITASSRIEISAYASVEGDLKAPLISIAKGAFVKGNAIYTGR